MLKVLAGRDRAVSTGPDDLIDLHALLEDSAMGPDEDDVCGDPVALDATDADLLCAGPFRFGRARRSAFLYRAA